MTLTTWSLIIGIMSSSVFIPIIQQPKWTNFVRALVTFAFSIVVGFGNAFFNHQLDGVSILSSIMLVMVSAWSSYLGFAKQLGLAASLEQWSTMLLEKFFPPRTPPAN